MAKAHLKVHMGGVATAIEFYQTAPTPNLIIVESRREPRELLESLRDLAEYCDPTPKVVVIGHYNDVGAAARLTGRYFRICRGADLHGRCRQRHLDHLRRSGIRADRPLDRLHRRQGRRAASTIAHNIAWSMSTLFKSEVVVADLDLAFGTANINFDQDPAQGIAEAVFSPERIDEVYLDRLLAKCSEHLSLLAAPSTLERVYDFDPDAFAQIIERRSAARRFSFSTCRISGRAGRRPR